MKEKMIIEIKEERKKDEIKDLIRDFELEKEKISTKLIFLRKNYWNKINILLKEFDHLQKSVEKGKKIPNSEKYNNPQQKFYFNQEYAQKKKDIFSQIEIYEKEFKLNHQNYESEMRLIQKKVDFTKKVLSSEEEQFKQKMNERKEQEMAIFRGQQTI